MKIILLHSDFIEYEAKKKALKTAPETDLERHRVEECLVVFTAIEKSDEGKEDVVAEKCVEEVKKVAEQIKVKRIVLYPWVHLTDSPSKPASAVKTLDKTFELLSKDFEAYRSPFGYYKTFNISVKGHPLAELSREISAEGKTKEANLALEKEKTLKSEWFVLDKGKLVPAKEFNFVKHPNLKKFYDYESSKNRVDKKAPPHIKLMREHELVDYEPGSDGGHFRWYPKGELMKRLLEEHISNYLVCNGAMQVETPIMYDTEHPQLSKYLNRFPARQYNIISDNKNFFLRFAACFGQYLMGHDMTISYKHLPLRMFELTKYSFRREQSGELSGIRRLRAFTMPDMHTLCKDMTTAKSEFVEQFEMCMEVMGDLGIEYEAGIRFVKSWFDENPGFAKKVSELYGRPMLVEMWNEQFFYFVTKFEFNVVDSLGKAAALSTVQIDTENAREFDMSYTNSSGKKEYPILLHASISGAIEREVWAILEHQAMRSAKGEKALFPLWLAPTQVRICPVNQDFLEQAKKLAEKIPFRVDIDDRDLSVGKKIRKAEQEWVPYIIVFGEKEAKGEFKPRVRGVGEKEMTVDSLVEEISELTLDKPFLPLSLPMLLSKRPTFVG